MVCLARESDRGRLAAAPRTPSCRLGRGVVLARQDGTGRLIDLERGRFYALDGLGSHLLSLALEHDSDEAVRRIAAEYEVSEKRVRDDWVCFFATLRHKGLVVRRRPCRRPPGRASLWLLLALAWLSLRLLGWMGTVRLWRRGRAPLGAEPAVDEEVRQIDEAVRAAAARHLLNPQCKERALVSWHLLRNGRGLPAELVVGVMSYPFQAHAWVECGGLTVSDERRRCEMYTPAARFQ
jgi:hypothetical protein